MFAYLNTASMWTHRTFTLGELSVTKIIVNLMREWHKNRQTVYNQILSEKCETVFLKLTKHFDLIKWLLSGLRTHM